jgi:hypothetical protein
VGVEGQMGGQKGGKEGALAATELGEVSEEEVC